MDSSTHEVFNVFSSLIKEFKPLVKRKNDKKMQAETITTIKLNILFFIYVTPKFFYSSYNICHHRIASTFLLFPS
jgi:hypothetical protein